MSSGSVSFDRAAEYYDATRGRSPEGAIAETDLLVQALRGLGTVLEIGVGTGQLAIPIERAGVPVVGVDISPTMLEVLARKVSGRPFPLVLADATALPLADDSMGAALFRWVLHLIPNWRDAVAELVRVVRPAGLVVAEPGGSGDGLRTEIQRRFCALAGVDRRPVGLDWDDQDALDEELRSHGATASDLPAFRDRDRDSVGDHLRALEEGSYSWTWPVAPDDRRRAVEEIRAWLEADHGPIESLAPTEYEVRWRAYRLA